MLGSVPEFTSEPQDVTIAATVGAQNEHNNHKRKRTGSLTVPLHPQYRELLRAQFGRPEDVEVPPSVKAAWVSSNIEVHAPGPTSRKASAEEPSTPPDPAGSADNATAVVLLGAPDHVNLDSDAGCKNAGVKMNLRGTRRIFP
ncbi:hypothetical protein VTH82DRAFT_3082 [Thermothelomyces myriococcoides]